MLDERLDVLSRFVSGITLESMLDLLERAGVETNGLLKTATALSRERIQTTKRWETSRAYAYWIQSVHSRLQEGAPSVPKVAQLERAAFEQEYYFQNRPLFVERAYEPGSFQWPFDRIRNELGHAIVEVSRERSKELGVSDHAGNQNESIRLADFVDEIRRCESRDVYLTAQNLAIQGELGKVLHNFKPLDGILREPLPGEASLFMGPKGAFSPLHFDGGNVVIVQLLGTKRVILIRPEEFRYLYVDREKSLSMVDVAVPDYNKFPLYRFAHPVEVIVPPGSALFVPVGWFHYVESLSPSFSASITSFLVSNYFPIAEHC